MRFYIDGANNTFLLRKVVFPMTGQKWFKQSFGDIHHPSDKRRREQGLRAFQAIVVNRVRR